MSDLDQRIASLSRERLLLLNTCLQQRLGEMEQAAREPIAVLSIGCRFPGARTPDEFWQLLSDRRETVTEVPSERWDIDAYYSDDPNAEAKMYTRYGSFIDDVATFDHRFFGISSRETLSTDPQQRLLLETSWEALERAGWAGNRLRRARTGVFVGMGASSYTGAISGTGDFDAYSGTGNSMSVAAGRISYVLGLEGPSIAIDTSCSSSLVAVDLACRYLRAGECDVALAGGVNLTLAPEVTIYFCKFKALSPTGHCHTFDAAADGYVRGEGCGVLVLKRLSDALAGHDPILGLIRGSAVGHDGRTGGLTIPNRYSQADVIRSAQRVAGIDPAAVDYIEAHGTGTALGDPIEIQALADVFGNREAVGRNLLVGSLKTNIGHTEAASGVASMIKTLLALRHESIPAHLNLRNPNPLIPWSEIPITIPTESTDWNRRDDRPRIAGISSFGFSGTNAHVILQEADQRPSATEDDDPETKRTSYVLSVSARNPAATKTLAARMQLDLADGNAAIADFAHTSLVGRAHFPYRHAAVVRKRDEAIDCLKAWATADDDSCQPIPSTVRTLMLIPPVALWKGFSWQLYRQDDDYRGIVQNASEVVARIDSNIDIATLFETPSLSSDPTVSRVLDVVARLSFVDLFRRWGVMPTVVSAWGGMELAAFLAAEAVDLTQSLEWTVGRIIGKESAMPMRIEPRCGILDPASGKLVTDLPSNYSDEDFHDLPEGIGRYLDDRSCDVTYVIGSSLNDGIMTSGSAFSVGAAGDDDPWYEVARLLAALHRSGVEIDWQRIQASQPCRTVAYSTYPFERQTHWRYRPKLNELLPALVSPESASDSSSEARSKSLSHPIPIRRQPGPPPFALFYMPVETMPQTTADLPALTWFPELLLAAATELWESEAYKVTDLELHDESFEISATSDTLWLTLPQDCNSLDAAEIWCESSLGDANESQWIKLATARIDPSVEDAIFTDRAIDELADLPMEISGFDFYGDSRLRNQPHVVDRIRTNGTVATATLRLPKEELEFARDYLLHPMFLEGCRQSLLSRFWLAEGEPDSDITVRFEAISFYEAADSPALCCDAKRTKDDDLETFDVTLRSTDGSTVAARIRATIETTSAMDTANPDPSRDSAVKLPDPAEICRDFDPISADTLDESWPTVDNACREMLVGTMLEIGLNNVDEPFQPDDLARRLGVDPRMEEWVVRWCALASSAGILQTVENGLRFDPSRVPDQAAGSHDLDDAFAQVSLDIARGVCPYLPAFMRAEQDSDVAIQEVFRLFDRSISSSESDEILTPILSGLVEAILPNEPGRPARVLEINAGVGVLTRTVQPSFQSADYVACDSSPLLLSLACREMEEGRTIEQAVIDLDTPLPAEHCARYDIILCPSPWYAAGSQETLLRGFKRLLLPGGLLFIALPTGATPWLDLYFALGQMGWRPTRMAVGGSDHTARHWISWLRDAGFDQVDSIFGVDSPLPKTILVARASEKDPSTIGSLPVVPENPVAAQLEFWNRFWHSPPEEYSLRLEAFLRHEIAAVMGDVSPEDIDPTRPISELGFDSLSAVELSRRLDPVFARMSIPWQEMLGESLHKLAEDLSQLTADMFDALKSD